MSGISCAMDKFYGSKYFSTIYIGCLTINDRFVGTPYTLDQFGWVLSMPFDQKNKSYYPLEVRKGKYWDLGVLATLFHPLVKI